MSGLSVVYNDGIVFDPPLGSCAGCNIAEAKIRALLDRIANSFWNNPTKFLGFELPKSEPVNCSMLFHHWVQRFESEAMCPDLKKRIEALVYMMLNERYGLKRKRETVSDTLMLLRWVAADPFDRMREHQEGWRDEILRARKALFVRITVVLNAEEFPCLKKQKSYKYLRATNGRPSSYLLATEPIRRSKRTLLEISESEVPRKHIPIGPLFQADVPDWIAASNEQDLFEDDNGLNNSRWLGTKIWPIEGDNRQLTMATIGKGRPNLCDCSSQGSMECSGFHVNKARHHLKSDLGPSFCSLGFAEMGEEVSKSWTQEEQMRFDDLVRQNPSSKGESFWEPAVKYFTSKSRKDIVSFYFNVFVLRWMSIRTRLGAWAVESSDDENIG